MQILPAAKLQCNEVVLLTTNCGCFSYTVYIFISVRPLDQIVSDLAQIITLSLGLVHVKRILAQMVNYECFF